jgi:hypothetical protein
MYLYEYQKCALLGLRLDTADVSVLGWVSQWTRRLDALYGWIRQPRFTLRHHSYTWTKPHFKLLELRYLSAHSTNA